MNVQKLNKILRIFVIIKQYFLSKTKTKFFFCTCIVLDADINLKELDQYTPFPFGGLIGYGNSSLDYFLQTPKTLDYMPFYKTLLDL